MHADQSDSLERIQAYIDIEHEPRPTESGQPPAAWPASGELSVQNLSARYSQVRTFISSLRYESDTFCCMQSGPKVLHDISFRVKSGERIGIVGRTGSGKVRLRVLFPYLYFSITTQSSLTLALLRCILTEGTVYLDGIPTDNINLDALRSRISIIPQTVSVEICYEMEVLKTTSSLSSSVVCTDFHLALYKIPNMHIFRYSTPKPGSVRSE